MAGEAPRFTVLSVTLRERDVRLRLPFRFGVITLTHAPQAFVTVRVRLVDGREGEGHAAEMLVPKWFDKNPALSHDDNIDQLRTAVAVIAEAYVADRTPRTGFDRFAAHYASHLAACESRGLNALVAGYGPALVDRAALDAVLRLSGVSFSAGMRANVAGMRATSLTPDLEGFDVPAFLASLRPATRLFARHTVGLVDPLVAADIGTRLNDGLPETLEEVVATHGHRHFKLKVAGDVRADIARLERIAAVIDRNPAPYLATLDGNEQFADVEGIAELWARMVATPGLARLAASTRFIEQPIARATALDRPVTSLASARPLLVDESDSTLDTFPRARAMGYTGISSKACKGFYKSLLNAARCVRWNDEARRAGRAESFFMSAEDLTCQAGLAVQQDLALVSMLGVDHVERNGHHYVDGFGTAPRDEQARFLAAHPDLYHRQGDHVRLRIDRGALNVGSLDTPGFGSAAIPDVDTMRTSFVVDGNRTQGT